MSTSRASKLLALALHASTPEPEAEVAILAWLRLARSNALVSVDAPPPAPAPVADWRGLMPKGSSRRYDPATDTSPVLAFGKFRGQRVRKVWSHSPGYLRWCAENLALPLAVRQAIDDLLGTTPEPEPAAAPVNPRWAHAPYWQGPAEEAEPEPPKARMDSRPRSAADMLDRHLAEDDEPPF